MDIEFKRVDPVEVTKTDKDKQERVLWVKEAMAATTAATKEDLEKLTYEVNPFIKKVEEKTYWEYDIDKVKQYLNKLKNIKNFKDIANIDDWEKKTGAYTVKWIMAVQIALKALWVAPNLTIDWVLATKGNFSGSATVQAISDFQKKNNIRDKNGVPYGPTIEMLLEKLGGAVSGTASDSSVNDQNDTGNDQNDTGKVKPNQTPTSPVVLEQQKTFSTPEEFVNDLVNQLKTAKNTKKDILAVEKALRDYLKEKDFSEFKRRDFKTEKDGKYYYDGLVGGNLAFVIWTFKKNVRVDGVMVVFSGKSYTFKELRIIPRQDANVSSVSPETAVNPAWTSESTAPQNPITSESTAPQNPTEWQQNEVSEKTDEELTKEVIDFFSQKDTKNPQTTIFDTLAHWNGRDFEELGRVLSKLSLDGLAGKTNALRELMRNLNQIVTILNQNKRFMLFDGVQRKKALLKQIDGIKSKVWGISEWKLNDYEDRGALLQNKEPNPLGTRTSDNNQQTSDNNQQTPDNNDQVSVQVHKEEEKGLTKDNVSYSDLMKALDLEKQGKSTNNPQNDTLLKSDADGSKYFLIDGKKYYQIPDSTADEKGNEVSPVLDKGNYYEITKDGDLTVISFWPVDENGYITDPEFSLKSNGDRSFKDADDQEATKKTNKKNKSKK